MPKDDRFFTPEEIDEQIDFLVQLPEKGDKSSKSAARVIAHLQQYYPPQPVFQAAMLEHAWERIVAEHQQAKHSSREKGHLILMEEYQKERQTMQSQPSVAKKRGMARQLNLLAAVLFVGLLVGGMVLLLNGARQVQTKAPQKPHQSHVASGGTPLPTPSHPITGGPCTLDTTHPHPQLSKTNLPGLYVFAENIQSDNVLYRYNTQTHQVAWSQKFCNAFQTNINGPVEVNGILYLAGDDWTSGSTGYLYALNQTDGSVIWGVRFDDNAVGESASLMGMVEQVTVTDGIAYVMQRAGTVYALDALTGKQLWTYDTGRDAFATTAAGGGSIVDPSSIQVVNGVAYGSIVDRVFALDAKKGNVLWEKNFNNALNINQSPTIADGMVYFTTDVPGYGTVTNPDTYIYALDSQTGTQKWHSVKLRGYLNAPIALNGKVYVSAYDGTWYTLNSTTGVVEAQRSGVGGGYGDPMLINGTLYTVSNNRLAALNPDGSTQWSRSIAGEFPGISDVQGGIIYVSTRNSGIYAYSAKNGALLWHYAGYLSQPESNLMVSVVPQN